MTTLENRLVYLLVDGENIDRTLGQILARKPKPEQRPRWDRVKIFIEKEFCASCRPLFFLNATEGVPGSFIQALKAVEFIPIPLTGSGDIKVVDSGIIKMLEAINEQSKSSPSKPGVVLVSHDADFKEKFASLQGHELAIIAFREYLSGNYMEIPSLKVFDLEEDIRAFKKECGPLPRLRSIDIEEFDPFKFL